MTQIDITTGLPVVPEGHFWEVSLTEDSDSRQDGSLTVSLNTWRTSKVAPNKAVTRSWKTLWMVPTDVTPAPTVKKRSKRLFSKVMQDREYFFKDGEKAAARLNGWVDDGAEYSSSYKMMRNWSPTPENILKAALVVMEEFNTSEEKKAKELALKQMNDTLVGFYPPKKLEGTTNGAE